jgi:DNA-binding NarL/FixJ family response regulator
VILAPYCTIVRETYDARALLNAVEELRPEVVVHSLSTIAGVEVVSKIHYIDARIRIVVIAHVPDPAFAAEAMHRGASAYLLDSCSRTELLYALRAMIDGHAYLSPALASDVIEIALQAAVGTRQLTSRQREILRLFAMGLSMKEIAATLHVSPRTIAFHKYRMMDALQIRSSAELVRFAVTQRIV